MLFDVRLTVVIVARVERDRVRLVLRVREISCDDIFSFLCINFSALHFFFALNFAHNQIADHLQTDICPKQRGKHQQDDTVVGTTLGDNKQVLLYGMES